MVISLLFSVLHDEVLFLFSGMEAVLILLQVVWEGVVFRKMLLS